MSIINKICVAIVLRAIQNEAIATKVFDIACDAARNEVATAIDESGFVTESKVESMIMDGIETHMNEYEHLNEDKVTEFAYDAIRQACRDGEVSIDASEVNNLDEAVEEIMTNSIEYVLKDYEEMKVAAAEKIAAAQAIDAAFGNQGAFVGA